jgi:hypothetical protein
LLVAACDLVLEGGLKLCFPSSRRSGQYFTPRNRYQRCAAEGEAPQLGCLPGGQASRPSYWALRVRRALQAMLHLDSTRSANGATISRPSVFALCCASWREAARAPCFHVVVEFQAGNPCAFSAPFVSQYLSARATHRWRLAHVVPGHAGSRSRPLCSSRVYDSV